MPDDPIPADQQPSAADDQEIVVSPAGERPIVADTGNRPSDRFTDSVFRSVNTTDLADRAVRVELRQETRVHMGPLPDARTLREYAEIYPNAPKIIFEEFKAQSAHRRDLEKQGIATGKTLALRGQIIGGAVVIVGLLVSGGVAAAGYSGTGFSIAVACIGTVASLFVYGQESQKRELKKKQELRKKIDEGRPVEELEQDNEPAPH